MLYACDPIWWRHNRGLPEFTGLKVTSSHATARKYGLRAVTIRDRHELLMGPPGTIGSGRNGGFQALNLAMQFGPPEKIILIGYDMRVDLGVHWHGKHPTGFNNPDEAKVARWAALLDSVAPAIKAAGVTVINASPVSALKAWPKMTVSEAL